MASSNACWGVELGSGAIKALKLEADGDDVRVTDFAVIPHSKVLSTPDLDQDDAMRVALGTLASRVDFSGASVAVSVPGHSAFARFAKLPPVEPKKAPEVVKFEAVQQIPFPLEEVEWDYQTFTSPDSPDVEVGIFAITRERINGMLDQLRDVGIVPDAVTLSPVAVYNAMAFDLQFTESSPSTVLLDIGTNATDLIVADAGRVWMRTFPIGGHRFTEALVNAFKLTYAKAERLKRDAEQSKHARHVLQAMRPVFTDLGQDVQRSIGYYKQMHPDANLERLVGMGSTFQLPGLRKFLKQQLGMDVYRLDQYKRLSFEGQRGEELSKSSINFATAYGLALQGLDRQTIDANLMPVQVVREAMWKKKVGWFGAAAGVAAATSAAMFAGPFMDSSAVASASPDPIIQRAISETGRLRTEAQEAGVVGSARPDLSAANLVALMDNPRVHPMLLDDIATMLSEIEQGRVEGDGEGDFAGPAFNLKNMRTRYVPPNQRAYPRERDERGRVRQRQPQEEMAGEEEPHTDVPRIRIELELRTNHPEPRRYAMATLYEWLRSNEVRDGVPYIFSIERERVQAEDARAARTDAPRDRRSPRPEEMIIEEEIGEDVEIVGGAAPPTRPGDRARRDRRVQTERLEELAPIERPDEEEAGATVRLMFIAAITEPEDQEQQGGGQ